MFSMEIYENNDQNDFISMKTKQNTHTFSVVSEIYENAPYDELTLMIKLHPRLPQFRVSRDDKSDESGIKFDSHNYPS